MAKAVVLLFVLDSLPGLLGVTCDSTIAAPVVQVIGKKLNLSEDSIEQLQHNWLYQRHKFQELSPESVNNVGFPRSFQESYEVSIEKSPNFVEHVYKENTNKKEDVLESMAASKNVARNASEAEFSETSSNLTNLNYFLNTSKNEVVQSMDLKSNVIDQFPESASFLAAIFESVGNVTAQTCGGVVLSSRWVLTAASCVNVLGPFYTNSSNERTDNYYSIVVGAKDPLKDGTVHQVSKIYLHPTPANHSKPGQVKNWLNSMIDVGACAPSLALLRVEPEVKGLGVDIMESRRWDGLARIYGWALRQNQTDFQMSAVSSSAMELSPSECKRTYEIVQNNTTMCLSVNETASKYTRMISGCPVVVLQDGRLSLLALALTDGTQPLLATPLSVHRDWLIRITSQDNQIDGKFSNKLRK